MRLTMAGGQRLLDALDDLESAAEDTREATETWMGLDGETDPDSREERRDAREDWEMNLETLQEAVQALADALK